MTFKMDLRRGTYQIFIWGGCVSLGSEILRNFQIFHETKIRNNFFPFLWHKCSSFLIREINYN